MAFSVSTDIRDFRLPRLSRFVSPFPAYRLQLLYRYQLPCCFSQPIIWLMKQSSRMHRRHTENRFCKKLGPHTVDAVTITLRDAAHPQAARETAHDLRKHLYFVRARFGGKRERAHRFLENSGRGPTVDIPFVKTKKQDYLQKYSG